MAVGLITFSTFPVFVAFLEPAFFNESFRKSNVVLAVLTLAGVALVVPEWEPGNRTTQGAVWGMVSGLTFAVLSLLNRRFAGIHSSLKVAFYQDAAAALILLPWVAAARTGHRSEGSGVFWCCSASCLPASPTPFFIQGLATVRAQTASIIACMEPVYGILAAAVILGEIPSARVLAGGGVILACTWTATVAHAREFRK